MLSSEIFEMLKDDNRPRRPRVLAFGSSNTQRCASGMHWFDCFEYATAETFPTLARCTNSGIGGNTTRDLLARFDEEAALYKPDMTFITIGGNDSNPDKKLSKEEFRDNLLELHRRFTEMDCSVVFQTYYSPNPKELGPMDHFYGYMDVVRAVAKETDSDLIDHLARWEPMRKMFTVEYETMMKDGFHVNHLGNMVMGMDIARHFGLVLGRDREEYWRQARAYHRLMDVANNTVQ